MQSVRYILPLILILAGAGCSTKKTGWAHRTYHNTTSRYNGYFNAKELVLAAEASIYAGYVDDYREILPVFRMPDDDSRQGIMGDMQTAIEKCETVIRKHSISVRGEEHVNWIDDSHFIIGKAYFLRGENVQARQMFNYVAKKHKEGDRKDEAQIWLAKTYIEDENYEKAESILSLVDGNKELDPKLYPDLKLTLTDLYLRAEDYELAIPELTEAIDHIKDRHFRMRETYLLAQLYREEGDMYLSGEYYKKVIKGSPDYDMVFYAKLNQALTTDFESGGVSEARKELISMAEEEKNADYRDQIYYALGQLDERIGYLDQAFEDYTTSTEVSNGNDQQKALSFLRLGELYFNVPEYENAQRNFDSCMLYLDPEYARYEELSLLSENLNDLIQQIAVIHREDSLQALLKLDSTALAELIEGRIKDFIRAEEEREAEEAFENDEGAGDFGGEGPGLPGGGPGLPGSGPKGSGAWIMYDPVIRGQGAAEFKKNWGNRKNEDHWRRSNKRQEAPQNDFTAGDSGDGGVMVSPTGDTIRQSSDELDPNYYLSQIPFSEEALAASNAALVEAYYALAGIYRDQLFDLPPAVEALETMNQRFDPNDHMLDAYYALYRMFLDLDETDKAKYYKRLLLTEYPDSDYAKLINDPEYLKKAKEANKEATEFYAKTYGYYDRGYYLQALENCNDGLKRYGDTELRAKFLLLRALCYGHEQGKGKLLAELRSIEAQYADTEEGVKAAEYIALLTAEVKVEEEEPKVEYNTDIAGKQVVVIIIPKGDKNVTQLMTDISNFNRKLFRMDGLKTTQMAFGADSVMVTVKQFNQPNRAKYYTRAFEKDTENLSEINAMVPEVFILSMNNYALFFKSKDIDGYKTFYSEHYLK